jgi:ribosomal protein S12 methylthiotransferase
LCDFVREQRFDHVGVFPYYQETGTPAATLEGQIPDDVKEERRKQLFAIQTEISRRRLAALVGTEQTVLIDGPSEESEHLLRGRLASQAPDVDGQVYVAATAPVRAGTFLPVRITQSGDHDLVAEA